MNWIQNGRLEYMSFKLIYPQVKNLIISLESGSNKYCVHHSGTIDNNLCNNGRSKANS